MVGCTGLAKLSTKRNSPIVSLCAVRDRSCRKIPENIVIVVQDVTIERPVLTVHSAQVIVNGVLARLVSRNRGW
jgi:hypothetical protein